MGDLDSFMDEGWIIECFKARGFTALNVRIVNDARTGARKNFCFVDFGDVDRATMVLNKLQNVDMPGTDGKKQFRLNRAEFGKKTEGGGGGNIEYSLFVGDITNDVTDVEFLEFFREKYESVRSIKIVKDHQDNTKGYGFARFFDEKEFEDALKTMNGITGLGQKPLRVGRPNKSKNSDQSKAGAGGVAAKPTGEFKPPTLTSEELKNLFNQNPWLTLIIPIVQLMQSSPSMQAYVFQMANYMQQCHNWGVQPQYPGFIHDPKTHMQQDLSTQAQAWAAQANPAAPQQQMVNGQMTPAAGTPYQDGQVNAGDNRSAAHNGGNPMQQYMVNKPSKTKEEEEEDDVLVEHTTAIDVDIINQQYRESEQAHWLEMEEALYNLDFFTKFSTDRRPILNRDNLNNDQQPIYLDS